MSYIDKNLLNDEQILFRTKKHLIIFFIPILWTVGALILLINSNPMVQTAAILFAILALVSWANEALNYITSEFAVTTKRIMMKEGFFFRHGNDLRLATIANVTVNQSLLGQLLNYGTVIIQPFGGIADPFTQIALPNVFQKHLQEQLDRVVK